jgi:hypothetical protein
MVGLAAPVSPKGKVGYNFVSMAGVTQPTREPAAGPSRWRQRGAALALVALGAVLLAANLGLAPAGWEAGARLAGPALLAAAGAWLVWAARRGGAAEAESFFIERGEHAAGELAAMTGAADLEVGALAGDDSLAAGQFPAARGPGLRVQGNSARVELSGRQARPWAVGGRWEAQLARGLPWVLDVRSWLGDLELDLEGLDVTRLRVRSSLGHTRLTLPRRGQAQADVRLWAGDLRLRVPEGVAVRARVRAGPLASVRVDERRFVELAPGEWASPLFAVSANRCTLNVSLWAGDLELA